MCKIKKCITVIFSIIVVIGAVVLAAFLLYGNEIRELYESYFGEPKEEVLEIEVPKDEEPVKNEEPEEEPEDITKPDTSGIVITSLYKDKIVYTTTATDPAPFKEDCDKRGGTFNECGSPCGPDAEFCIEVCAYTCENLFKEEEMPEEETPEDWIMHESEEYGFSFKYPPDMDLEMQGDMIRVDLWGPTQRPDTELYDGILISIWRPPNDQNIDLKQFADQGLENQLAFEGEMIQPVTHKTYGEIEGYEFSVVSLGEFTTFYFENLNDEIIEISYFVEDPANQGFEETLKKILGSLENVTN